MNCYEKGIEVLEEMTGAEGELLIDQLTGNFPDFKEAMIGFGFGQIYGRGKLDLKSREIVTLTALITQGAFEQLNLHVKAALNVGVTKEEILEIILQCAAYAGFPKACSALAIVNDIF